MRTKAFRRHQEFKKKQWVKNNFNRYFYHGLTPAIVGIRAHSPAICSCAMCGNPRKLYGVSFTERKMLEAIHYIE